MSQFTDDSHVRFWGVMTVSGGVPALVNGYNIASIVDTAQGIMQINFSIPFAQAFWPCGVTIERPSTTLALANMRYAGVRNATMATGSVQVECWDGGATPAQVDPATWGVSGKGVQ